MELNTLLNPTLFKSFSLVILEPLVPKKIALRIGDVFKGELNRLLLFMHAAEFNNDP